MRRVISVIALFFNVLAALALLMASIAGYISPTIYWIFAFLGLSLPLLFVINILFIIFWSIFWKKEVAVSIIALLFSLWHIPKFLSFNSKKVKPNNVTAIRVMNYNVNLFNQYNDESTSAPEMLSYISNKDADIICLQDFFTIKGKLSEKYVRNKFKKYPHAYINYSVNERKREVSYGVAIFSKYPILKKHNISFGENTYNSSIYADVLVNTDTLRVFCCHLESTKLKEADKPYKLRKRIIENDIDFKEIKSIVRNLRKAYLKRAKQVDSISNVASKTRFPIIFCGDFNDIPASYTYSKLRGSLYDSYVEAGNGLKPTYRGLLPTMRIDYIFSDKQIIPYKYSSPRIKYSDHYPIIVDFYIKHRQS